MPRRVKFEKRFNYQKFLITFSYVTLNPKIKVSVETTLIQFPKVRKKYLNARNSTTKYEAPKYIFGKIFRVDNYPWSYIFSFIGLFIG